MRKSMVASNGISAWRSTTRSQTNALRKSKPGCRRSGVGYAAVPCRNRKASSRRVREEASRSRGHDRILFARIDIEEAQTVQRGQLSQERLQHVLWLHEQLLSWFEQHRRSFPWREPARSSYELVVAEILLQRTTAAKVARAFPGFVARYPTWEAMARTPLEELQTSLRPLGLWRQKAQIFLDLADIVEKNRG